MVLLGFPSAASAEFGIEAFSVTAIEADGTIDERAATHPFALDLALSVEADQVEESADALHRVQIDLPPGLVGNPLVVPRCSVADFFQTGPGCPASSQIGVFRGNVEGLGEINAPIYNVAPSSGSAAAFGVSINGESFTFRLNLATTGAGARDRLSGTVPSALRITALGVNIWGVPADQAHDAERTCPESSKGCSSDGSLRPLLTLPASCSSPLRTELTASSLGPPSATVVATALSRDAGGNPRPLSGCEAVPFDPRLAVQTEGAAQAPTALTVGVELPQYEGAHSTAAAPLAELRLELPQGMALSPPSGSWLVGCPPGSVGLVSAPGAPPVFDEDPATCPPASRLGSVRLQTPLIDHALSGAIYLATPASNPFSARYAAYLLVEDQATATVLKIPVRLDADPATGRLTVTIAELPPLPFNELDLEFGGGPRGPLVNPTSCGRYAAEGTFTPSTAPFSFPQTRSAGFTLLAAAGGKPCPPPEVERNAALSFDAGTTVPAAGRDSPLVIRLAREVSDQHFGSFELTLPPGLLANLSTVKACPDAAVGASSVAPDLIGGNLPGCPVDAALGRVQIALGAGSEPLQREGNVYLAGPYRGDPYSLAIVVPAAAGPFDFGTIVQRAALSVDPRTAQISVRTDPLPQILAGVPLELRALTLELDRPGAIRNPTACGPMAIAGAVTTSLGQVAPVSTRFQVSACAGLPFKPKAALRFSGGLRRNMHPALRAVLRGRANEASISSARFTLPPGELLDLRHLRALCAQGTAPDRCPRGSELGQLRLATPFLDAPAEGSVYLLSPSHRLPELVAELHSGPLRFVLHGRTATRGGQISVSFPAIPDIPLSTAVLSLDGGRRGIFVNSHSLCAGAGMAEARLRAHNGKRRELRIRPRVDGPC